MGTRCLATHSPNDSRKQRDRPEGVRRLSAQAAPAAAVLQARILKKQLLEIVDVNHGEERIAR
ncbi:MAG: hypothetical protein QOE55_6706 [Acidobacteriaceae bacterium]|nr:hypothetical protein [Acidobacteriaceae bacterium]